MVDRVHLTPAERDIVQTVIRQGLRARVDQWTVARIAIARSLQQPEAPDPKRFAPVSKQGGGVELHSPQLTGEGRSPEEDFTDLYRALLSVYEGRNLFGDEADFHDSLQRHVRRGLELLRQEWAETSDFSDYLLQRLYVEGAIDSDMSADAADDLAAKVDRVLGQLGVGAEVVVATQGPRLTRLTLQLNALDDLDRFRRGLGKIAFALGQSDSKISSALAPGERRIYLTVPRPQATWRTVSWNEVKPALQSAQAAAMELPVCVGTDVMGEPLIFDLAEAPHLFVGGTTGSGKSICLHALLLSLLAAPERPELMLVDPKAVEFAAYEELPLLRGGGVLVTAESAMVALEDLIQEMDARQEKMAKLKARNLKEANARGARMRRIVAVIDELGDLLQTKRELEGPLIRLAQKARSAGIHLILATQRPEAATFSGLLRSNIPSRIALTVQKSAESRIILDETGAESLLMLGDMLVRLVGRPTQRAHGCRVDPSDILAAVRAL